MSIKPYLTNMRHKLRKLVLASSLIASSLFGGCKTNQSYPLEPESKIRVVPLQEFDYKATQNSNNRYNLDRLSRYGFRGYEGPDNKETKEFLDKRIRPSNKESFLRVLLEDAKILGYSKEEIEKLDAKGSILLAGKLSALRLHYDLDFLKLKEEKDERILSKKSGLLNTPVDVIYHSDMGVECVTYARVTAGIHETLKEVFNEGTKQVNLSYYFNDRLNHAWNQVSVVSEDTLTVSFIDPTHFDELYIRTAMIDPKKLEETHIRLLNALDEQHFGKGLEDIIKEVDKLKKDSEDLKFIFN